MRKVKSKPLDDDEETQFFGDVSGTQIEVSVSTYQVDTAKVERICSLLCDYYHLPSPTLSIAFISTEEMREMNGEFRQQDRSTDVLSFPQFTWLKPLKAAKKADVFACMAPEHRGMAKAGLFVLGDIVISLEKAEENAAQLNQSLAREVSFLLVHGFLHLLGYDHIDPKDEALMLAEQSKLMLCLEEMVPPLWQGCVERSLGALEC